MAVYKKPGYNLPRHFRSELFTDITRITAKMAKVSELTKYYGPRHDPHKGDSWEIKTTAIRIGAYIQRKSSVVRLSELVEIMRGIWGKNLPVEPCKALIGRFWPEICDHAERLERRDAIAKEWTLSDIRKAEIEFSLVKRTAFFSRYSMGLIGDKLHNYERSVDINGNIWVTRKSNGQKWKFDTYSCRLTHHREMESV